MLTIKFCSEVNYLSVFVAALAFWAFGAIWFMVIFGKLFPKGLEEMNDLTAKYTPAQRTQKIIITFLGNLAASFLISWFIYNVDYNGTMGWKFGFSAGVIAGSMQAVGDSWRNNNIKAIVVDALHPVIGMTLAGYIIGIWH